MATTMTIFGVDALGLAAVLVVLVVIGLCEALKRR